MHVLSTQIHTPGASATRKADTDTDTDTIIIILIIIIITTIIILIIIIMILLILGSMLRHYIEGLRSNKSMSAEAQASLAQSGSGCDGSNDDMYQRIN